MYTQILLQWVFCTRADGHLLLRILKILNYEKSFVSYQKCFSADEKLFSLEYLTEKYVTTPQCVSYTQSWILFNHKYGFKSVYPFVYNLICIQDVWNFKHHLEFIYLSGRYYILTNNVMMFVCTHASYKINYLEIEI